MSTVAYKSTGWKEQGHKEIDSHKEPFVVGQTKDFGMCICLWYPGSYVLLTEDRRQSTVDTKLTH